jgi:hypothetical protein
LCSSCMPSISVWRISEDAAPGDPIGSSCDWFTDNRAPSGPCLAGAIEGITGDLSNSLRVTYHAPATPATYHVPMLRSRSFWNAPSDQECNLRYHDYVFTSVVADDGLRIEV